jgi:hypothetical protein
MANTEISDLTGVTAVAGTNAFPVNEVAGPTTKKATVTQLTEFLNETPTFTGVPAAPTAAADVSTTQIATTAFVQTNGPVKVKSIASDATANATTGMVKITGMDVTVPAGTYQIAYYIIAQTSAATTSLKFAVNHTGASESVFCYNLFLSNTGVTAVSNAIDQENNVTTGLMFSFDATRIKNTTLGPQANTTDATADLFYIIRGLILLTNTGTLELYHGSETAASTTVKAGTCVIITKVG